MSSHGVPSVFWFIPSSGDRRYLGTGKGGRAADFRYFSTVAKAVDNLGYDGVLIPTGRSNRDGWVLASALASVTERLRLLVAVRPGTLSPTLAARLSATLDQVSGGRLAINIVAGGNSRDLAGDGILLDHGQRYEHASEWLSIYRQVLEGKVVDFDGKHIKVKGAQVQYGSVQKPYPPIYFGGSSDAGIRVAAQHADVYLTWGEPVDQVREKIETVRQQAAKEGRTVRFGLRVHVVVRRTEEEAWQAAEDLIRDADEETLLKARARLSEGESVGQARMLALHGISKDRDSLKVGPHLWAGVGLLRGGAGTALVGNPEQVAEAIREYLDLGIDTLVLSGYPHVEEAYYTAELLFPLLGKPSPLFEDRPYEWDRTFVTAGASAR